MLGDISKAEQIYIACGFTDMRKSIDGLAGIVQQNSKQPFSVLWTKERQIKGSLLGKRWICAVV